MSFTGNIFLVRHGVTDWNQQGIWQGWKGPGLNMEGRHQAELLARKLEGANISAIYSSDLPRAHETAAIISAKIGNLNPITMPCLRERDLGQLSGKSMKEIYEVYPNIAMERETLGSNDYMGVEKWADFTKRVSHCFQAISRESEGNVVVVTHGGCIMSLVRSYVDPSFDQIVDNCGVLKFRQNSHGYQLERL